MRVTQRGRIVRRTFEKPWESMLWLAEANLSGLFYRQARNCAMKAKAAIPITTPKSEAAPVIEQCNRIIERAEFYMKPAKRRRT